MAKNKEIPKLLDWRSLLSITAVITSLSALFVSYRQLQIASQEQQASVFPYLTMAYSNNEHLIELNISNDGNGPAFISGVEVRMHDTLYHDFWSPVKLFLDTLQATKKPKPVKSDLLTGWVLRPNSDRYNLFKLDSMSMSTQIKFWHYFTDGEHGMKAKIWYFDLYSNCWLFDSDLNTVTRCATCPHPVLYK